MLLLKKMRMLTMLEQMLTLNTVQACNLGSGKKSEYCHSNPVVTMQTGNYSELFRAVIVHCDSLVQQINVMEPPPLPPPLVWLCLLLGKCGNICCRLGDTGDARLVIRNKPLRDSLPDTMGSLHHPL